MSAFTKIFFGKIRMTEMGPRGHWKRASIFQTSHPGQRCGRCPQKSGISVNPIWTKGADYARHITTGPPIFLDDAAPLVCLKDQLLYLGYWVMQAIFHFLISNNCSCQVIILHFFILFFRSDMPFLFHVSNLIGHQYWGSTANLPFRPFWRIKKKRSVCSTVDATLY